MSQHVVASLLKQFFGKPVKDGAGCEQMIWWGLKVHAGYEQPAFGRAFWSVCCPRRCQPSPFQKQCCVSTLQQF